MNSIRYINEGSEEYEKIANLTKEMNLDINEAPFKYLQQLVV